MFFLHAYAEPVGGIGEIRHKQGAGCADGDCRRLTGDIYAELPQQPQTAAVAHLLDLAVDAGRAGSQMWTQTGIW